MTMGHLCGLLRHLISILGGYGIAIGAGDPASWEAIVGGTLALAAIAWSMLEKRT